MENYLQQKSLNSPTKKRSIKYFREKTFNIKQDSHYDTLPVKLNRINENQVAFGCEIGLLGCPGH